MIACMTQNRVIGKNNTLPWKQLNDMQRFKGLTYGHEVLMGRKTWDSMAGKVLPGRANKIVSRDPDFYPKFSDDSHDVIRDPELYLQECDFYNHDVFVIGGAQLYQLALPFAKRLYLTILDVQLEGDTLFPYMDDRDWKLIGIEKYQADDFGNQYGYNFHTYVRK